MDAVQLAYQRTRDALKVARRVLNADPTARRDTRLIDVSGERLNSEFDAMQDRLGDATVLNLWVVFERFVIDHVIASIDPNDEQDAFDRRVRDKAAGEIERWKFDELLNLYKGIADPHELGSARQVKGYRDWVAHRNPHKPPSAAILPEYAYRSLTAIVRTVEAERPGGSAAGS